MSSSSFVESNIRIEFPDENYFRISDCKSYRNVSAYSFKEVDVCWFDFQNNTLFLIELKDFTKALLSDNTEKRIWDISKKFNDSLLFLLSGFRTSSTVFSEMGFEITNSTKLAFIAVVNLNQEQVPFVSQMRDQLKSRFTGHKKLFDLKFTIIDSKTVSKIYPWITAEQ